MTPLNILGNWYNTLSGILDSMLAEVPSAAGSHDPLEKVSLLPCRFMVETRDL